jgi:predicted metal-dependent phosphoesterase TrpH
MSASYSIDLHTHSLASPDGGLSARHYRKMLESGGLNYIAVTDHDTVSYALRLQAELGEQIIVGEEITTREGDIIGLYLKEVVPAHLTVREAVKRIHEQGGLVYIPHPFETVRQGLSAADLETIADQVDIVETLNGRSLQNRSSRALAWAKAHRLPGAASSDAHGWYGWGKTYSVITEPPTRESLARLLGSATYQSGSPGLRGRLYPKVNRLRKRSRRA